MEAKGVTRDQIKAALIKHRGVYTYVAAELGITRQAVAYHVKGDKELEDIRASEEDRVNAQARLVMTDAIDNKDARAARWWLEKRDPDFMPKHQLQSPGGGPLLDFSGLLPLLTEEELEFLQSIRRRLGAGAQSDT